MGTFRIERKTATIWVGVARETDDRYNLKYAQSALATRQRVIDFSCRLLSEQNQLIPGLYRISLLGAGAITPKTKEKYTMKFVLDKETIREYIRNCEIF